jgi:hypothetical protein
VPVKVNYGQHVNPVGSDGEENAEWKPAQQRSSDFAAHGGKL